MYGVLRTGDKEVVQTAVLCTCCEDCPPQRDWAACSARGTMGLDVAIGGTCVSLLASVWATFYVVRRPHVSADVIAATISIGAGAMLFAGFIGLLLEGSVGNFEGIAYDFDTFSGNDIQRSPRTVYIYAYSCFALGVAIAGILTGIVDRRVRRRYKALATGAAQVGTSLCTVEGAGPVAHLGGSDIVSHEMEVMKSLDDVDVDGAGEAGPRVIVGGESTGQLAACQLDASRRPSARRALQAGCFSMVERSIPYIVDSYSVTTPRTDMSAVGNSFGTILEAAVHGPDGAAEKQRGLAGQVAASPHVSRTVLTTEAGASQISEDDDLSAERESHFLSLLLAIMIRNVPEGLLVGIAAASSTRLTVLLVLTLLMHNVPEGMVLGVFAVATGKKLWHTLKLATLQAVGAPIGAIVSFLIVSDDDQGLNLDVLGALFGIAAGLMCWTAVHNMLPTANAFSKRLRFTIIPIFIGMGIMAMAFVVIKAYRAEQRQGDFVAMSDDEEA